MKIKCSGCSKVLVIPAERLPKDKSIAFPCPNCSELIKIDLTPKTNAEKQLSRTATRKNYLTGEALKKQIVKTVDDLPPMPQTIIKAWEIMDDPKAGFKELADLFEGDQAIAAKILKLANSSYYGIAGGVSSIQKASVVLGQKTLGELITLAGVSGLLGNQLKGYGLDAGKLWKHSLAVGFGARRIAAKIDSTLEGNAFTAGLLHDSGKLILDPYIAERWPQFENTLMDGHTSFLEAEKAVLSIDHPEIASEVCHAWRIPEVISHAIQYHHHPSQSKGNRLAYIVHAADVIALMAGLGLGIDGTQYQIEAGIMASLGLDEDEFGDIMGNVIGDTKKITDE